MQFMTSLGTSSMLNPSLLVVLPECLNCLWPCKKALKSCGLLEGHLCVLADLKKRRAFGVVPKKQITFC